MRKFPLIIRAALWSGAISAIITLAQTSSLQAATLLGWDFAGNSGSEATVLAGTIDSGLASGSGVISRGSGLTASGNADRFNATGWATTSIANAVSGDDYMEFSLLYNGTNLITVDTIAFNWQRSSSGNVGLEIRSSLDGYSASLGTFSVVDNTSTQAFTTMDLGAAFESLASNVTFRVYGYAEATSGSGGFEGAGVDLSVIGSTAVAGGTYWDTNGATLGSGASSGDWSDSSWSASSTGDAATTTFQPNGIANFAAGTDGTGSYSVTVDTAVTVGGLNIEEGNVTLASGAGTLTLAGSGEVSVASGATATVTESILGTAGQDKTGAGTLTLSAANAYTGDTVIHEGTVIANHASALSSGSVTIFDGNLYATDGLTISNNLIVEPVTTGVYTEDFQNDSGGGLPSGTAANTTYTATDANWSIHNYSAIPSGGQALVSSYSGSDILRINNVDQFDSGTNSLEFVTLSLPQIDITSVTDVYLSFDAIDASNPGSFWEHSGGFNSEDDFTVQYSLDGGTTWITWLELITDDPDPASPATRGIFADGTNNLSLSVNGTTLDIRYLFNDWAADEIFGLDNISVSTSAAAAATIGENTGGDVTYSGSVTLNGDVNLTAATGGSSTFTGVVSGGASNEVTKTGGGLVVLTNTNTYSGATTITGGTLQVTGSIGDSNVTVESGAVLASGAGGTIANHLDVDGTLAPGMPGSIGAATVNGDVIMNAGSAFSWDLNEPGTDPGADAANSGSYDIVSIGGDLAGSGSVFHIAIDGADSYADAFWDTNKSWSNIFTVVGTASDLASIFSGGFSGTGVAGDGTVAGQGAFSWGTGSNSTTLYWTAFSAIPEVSNVLIGGVLGLGLLRRRRSKVIG